MISLLICFLIVAVLFVGGYFCFRYLPQCPPPHEVAIDYKPQNLRDELSDAILFIINDVYSPFYPARLSDHIITDIDIDSLDIVDLLYDVEQICGAPLSTSELYRQYGRNPTVAQVIAYARHEMQKQDLQHESCNPETCNPETCNNS